MPDEFMKARLRKRTPGARNVPASTRGAAANAILLTCSRGHLKDNSILPGTMGLFFGQRLGPYEIEAPLGTGGMGEVCRARDTRLDRLVALKVLRAREASDPHFQRRLTREAKSISQLNHPHIWFEELKARVAPAR